MRRGARHATGPLRPSSATGESKQSAAALRQTINRRSGWIPSGGGRGPPGEEPSAGEEGTPWHQPQTRQPSRDPGAKTTQAEREAAPGSGSGRAGRGAARPPLKNLVNLLGRAEEVEQRPQSQSA